MTEPGKIRDGALEEAAEICDQWADADTNKGLMALVGVPNLLDPLIVETTNTTAKELAKAIREKKGRPFYTKEERAKMKCPFPPEREWQEGIYPTPEAAAAYAKKMATPPPPKPPPMHCIEEGTNRKCCPTCESYLHPTWLEENPRVENLMWFVAGVTAVAVGILLLSLL
jgi:hypothetical protein